MKFFQTISQTPRIGKHIFWKIQSSAYLLSGVWVPHQFESGTGVRATLIQNPNQNKKLNIISWMTVTKFTVLSKKENIYSL